MATEVAPVATETHRSKINRSLIPEGWLVPLMLAPSLIALFIFVYGFIGMTIWVSMSNWNRMPAGCASTWRRTGWRSSPITHYEISGLPRW